MIGLIASWLISRRPSLTRPYAERLAKLFVAAALIVLAAIAFPISLGNREQAAVERDRITSKAEALELARDADERAHGAAAGKSKEVDDANERARQAAVSSDDPLRDAMRSLRTEAR